MDGWMDIGLLVIETKFPLELFPSKQYYLLSSLSIHCKIPFFPFFPPLAPFLLGSMF